MHRSLPSQAAGILVTRTQGLRAVARLVPALVLTAVAGCQCDKELGDVPGGVTGQACNGAGDPLGSAIVTATNDDTGFSRDTAADAVGTYTITALPPGSYTITAEAEGSVIELGTVTVESSVNAPVPDNCRDDPPPPEEGCVVGDICNRHVGSLVAGGDVLARVGASEVEGVTDDNGHFRVCGLDEGDGTVTIVAHGFQRTFPITIDLETEFVIDLDENCDVPTTSTGCMIASICDPAIGPNSNLVGAAVTVTRRGGSADEVTHELTDDLGFFEICALVPGTYDVRIQKGAIDTTEDVVVEAGETAVVVGPAACEDRVEVGRVEGQVCDEAAGGVFSGRVELRTSGGSPVGAAVLTDADGSFAFEGVAPGEYVIAFPDDPALQPIPITVTAFQTTVLTARNCPLPQDTCEDFVHRPEVTSDGRIFFIVDKSGSMLQPAQGFATADKWQSLKDAIAGVTTTFGGPDIDYALVAYPDPRNTDCEASANNDSCVVACNAGTQQVAMGGDGAQINGALDAISPFGGTPTAQTLANIKDTIETLAVIERPLAVVLATDGAPNCGTSDGLRSGEAEERTNCTLTVGSVCTSTADGQTDTSCAPFNCLDLTAVDRVREIADLEVDVHVIGIRGSNESSSAFTNTLNAMAVAGGAPLPAGSPTRFHDASNTQALQDALAAVTRRIVACNITTPFGLDDATSITLKIGNSPILQNGSHTNGWDVMGPNNIQLFGAACDRATASADDITIERCVRSQ